MIVPASMKEILQQKLVAERCAPDYSKVTMTLGDILGGDFFTEYIKKGIYSCTSSAKGVSFDGLVLGNILMLSEGKTTIGNMFTLQEGIDPGYMVISVC